MCSGKNIASGRLPSARGSGLALQPGAETRRPKALAIPDREPVDEEPIIVAERLTRKFGDFTAVDGVSFEIERGEIFGFLGSNGCGKTTTMKMLTGLLPEPPARRAVGTPSLPCDLRH